MCCKNLSIFLPKLSSSKLDNHCKILHKSWILKPSEDLSRGRDNPLREHSNPDQEQEQDGQEGEGGGHVVDGRPQGDEVDDDAGSCSQHLFNLSKSHNHNTMSKDFTPRPHLAFLVTKSRATSGLKPTLGFFQRPMPGHTVWLVWCQFQNCEKLHKGKLPSGHAGFCFQPLFTWRSGNCPGIPPKQKSIQSSAPQKERRHLYQDQIAKSVELVRGNTRERYFRHLIPRMNEWALMSHHYDDLSLTDEDEIGTLLMQRSTKWFIMEVAWSIFAYLIFDVCAVHAKF